MTVSRRGLLCAAALAGFIVSPALAADPIVIGDINSYTRMAAFTEPYLKGMELALAEINDAGGVAGRRLELISRDDDGDPGTAVRIAEEMIDRDGVAIVTGGFFSNVGLALSNLAEQRKTIYIAGEPLADSLVWENGNEYTFRLRPSTWMQAAMLAESAAGLEAKRWATIAPNYAYGKDAVTAFKEVLTALRPDVEFVAEQWPALFKIDAGAEVQALARAEPDAIFNVTFGPDVARFVREGTDRGLFEDVTVVSLLTGEPEYLDPMGDEAPEGWIITGYPHDKIDTPEHTAFRDAYMAAYDDYPRMGSLVGYNLIRSVGALLEATGGKTDTATLIGTLEGLEVQTPVGPITWRAIDHQATMGTFVGKIAVEDGRGTMVDWHYAPGEDNLPDDETVRRRRHGG